MALRRLLATFVTHLALLSAAFAQSLPQGWSAADVGAVGVSGSATLNGGTFTVNGAGADIWGRADAFRFLFIPLAGDGEVITRVGSLSDVDAWSKAGVMMRETLAPNSRHAFMLVSPAKGVAFQRRAVEGGDSLHTSGGSGTAPVWLKLTRAGSTFTAARSSDGVAWVTVGSQSIAMGTTVFAGVAVTSHAYGINATATFDWTQVASSAATSLQTTSGSLPAAYSTADIGTVGAAGSARGSRGNFAVTGSGADIWGAADAFRFVHTPLTGNGSIVAKVVSESSVHAWVKAGVMMRDGLTSDARHASMFVTPAKGLAFQRRTATGGLSAHTSGGAGTAPYWVKLTREGSTFRAYKSLDGLNWSLVGSDTIAMGATIQVGIAVTSHITGVTADATFAATEIVQELTTQPPPPPADAGGTSTLRLLHWNTHHGGIRSDGVYDPAGIAAWIAQINPHVASLNEVDTLDQMNAILSALTSRTGATWHASFSGRGNLVISKIPLTTTSRCVYPDGTRYAAHLGVLLGGRPINVWSTHLTVDSASARLAEAAAMQACALNWSEARLIAGDYNMQEGSVEYLAAVTGYVDAWKAAKALGTAVDFDGNGDGATRNSRIDYVFSSQGASMLTLKSAQVFDTRNAGGVTPSDHKPLLVVYDVR